MNEMVAGFIEECMYVQINLVQVRFSVYLYIFMIIYIFIYVKILHILRNLQIKHTIIYVRVYEII